MKDEIEYIKYEEEVLPDAETIQDSFQYWKWIEKLDANISMRNAWWTVKITENDTNSWYLSDKLTEWAWVFFQTQNPWQNETLKINADLIFWWNWSDWDLIIANWETVPLWPCDDIQT
jgi:hypothetical protein